MIHPGARLAFELRGDGLGLRCAGADDEFTKTVASGEIACDKENGRLAFRVELTPRRTGRLSLDLSLVDHNAVVLRQRFDFKAYDGFDSDNDTGQLDTSEESPEPLQSLPESQSSEAPVYSWQDRPRREVELGWAWKSRAAAGPWVRPCVRMATLAFPFRHAQAVPVVGHT